MTNANDTMSDDYEEYDEFDDEDEERGLSGFSVLVIGLVMIGAFISVVWIAYQQGIRTGSDGFGGGTPYVAADPEPIKIASADDSAPVDDREVYDVFDGDSETPVTVLAEGPEEPVARDAEDTIGSIAANTEDATAQVNDEDSASTSLPPEEAVALTLESAETEPDPVVVAQPAEASPVEVNDQPAAALGARSGTHVVQIGAFRSDAEAQAQWSRLQGRLGDFLSGKSDDIERADLGDRGVYHRLRIGPFSSYDQATAFCADLKGRGQDCLVKKL